MSEIGAERSALQRYLEARVTTTLKGKWRLERLVGAGAMAAVYQARHRNGNEVAVKILHPDLAFNDEVIARFLREGYIANRVKHPGTVRVHDDDVAEDGCAFLVMDLLAGESVEARWKRHGRRLAPAEVLAIAAAVLETLAVAHAEGIVHRDLKPANLFLCDDGSVRILDFGIARLRELGAQSATHSGMLLGTPAFMAPEQARGRWDEVDGRTDLWAVGATMFTLLTGRYVFEARTMQEALALAMTTPARSLSELAPDAAPALAAVVDKALRADPADRFADARAMLAAVGEALGRLSGGAALARSDGAAGVATIATSPGVASTLGQEAPEARRRASSRWLALAIVGGGLVAALAVASLRERGTATAAAPSTVTAPAPAPPTATAAPPVPAPPLSSTATATAPATAMAPAPSAASATPRAAATATAPASVSAPASAPAPASASASSNPFAKRH